MLDEQDINISVEFKMYVPEGSEQHKTVKSVWRETGYFTSYCFTYCGKSSTIISRQKKGRSN